MENGTVEYIWGFKTPYIILLFNIILDKCGKVSKICKTKLYIKAIIKLNYFIHCKPLAYMFEILKVFKAAKWN